MSVWVDREVGRQLEVEAYPVSTMVRISCDFILREVVCVCGSVASFKYDHI